MARLKRACRLLFLAAVCAAVLAAGAAASAAPLRLAVFPFQGGDRTSMLAELATDLMTGRLTRGGVFDVVERARLRRILNEQRIGASGAAEEESAARLGKLLGARYALFGTVAEPRDLYDIQAMTPVVSVRLVDTTTGRVAAAESETVGRTGRRADGTIVVSRRQALSDAIDKLAARLEALQPLDGSVVKVDGRYVHIDLGAAQGVREGQIFTVFKESAPGRKVATIRIIRVENDAAVGECRPGTNFIALTAGDAVRRGE